MRDSVLLMLTVIGFIILLSLGATPLWSFVILLFLIIGYLGIRYPNGASDWKSNKKESAYLLLTIGTVLLIIYLFYVVFTIVTFPSIPRLLIWAGALGLGALFVLSTFYPTGLAKKM